MPGSAIQVNSVSKRYRLGSGPYLTLRETLAGLVSRDGGGARREVWALEDVSFDVDEGEVLGVIGLNGAGKSTLLKILSRITTPTAGVSRTRGRVGALLEVGTGFHPELSGRENIFLNGAILGMTRAEIRRQFAEIVDFAGVEQFLDTPLKRYSSGMYLRLAFAVAAHVDPDIVIVDEVLAVGDIEFRERCMGRMSEFGREGRTVIFVSHDLGAVARICSRTVWLDHGRVRGDGATDDVIDRYIKTFTPTGGRAEFPHEPGKRVQLLSMAVTDREGRAVDATRRDEEFTLSARFIVRQRGPSLDMAFVLQNRQGVRLLDEDWSVDTGDALIADVVPREYEARLTVPPVLPAGEYIVVFWLGSAYVTYFYGEAMTFRLLARPDDPLHAVERDRVVQPATAWSVTALERTHAGEAPRAES
jgi:ABC-type polysaccharide/polyol phosphate transport system ATPase subunit